MLLMLLVTVELNDIFAFICGTTFGHRKLAPNTSPNKTVGGSLGALVLTTVLAAFLGHYVFRGTSLDAPLPLIALGLLISVGGQFGDLMLSSVKRDIGVKDFSALIPGHGGFLDRFDSLILVAPAAFHFIGYFRGFGWEGPTRIFAGVWP
jgi:phosphatidate cytidylyltransferase